MAVTLAYALDSRNRYDMFDDAAPWRGTLGEWQATLDACRLEASTEQPFTEARAALADLEPMLRAWETVAFLRDQHEISFRLIGGRMADGTEVVPAASSAAVVPDENEIYRRSNVEYPAPDETFARTALVDDLLALIWRFRHGELALPSVATAVLHALAAGAPGADGGIAAAYNVEPRLVEVFTELAGRGHPPVADQPPAAYRGPEWQWMQEAIRLLTLQAGRRTSGSPAIRLGLEQFRGRL
jgi:hypothetical protein